MTEPFTRRQLLGGRLKAGQAQQHETDVLVVLFQRGGADGLNEVVPYGDGGNYYGRRPAIGIPEPGSAAPATAIDLDGYFGLHPGLGAADAGNWQRWYDEKMLAIVHAAHMDDPDHTRSHFDAMDYMERGTPGEKRLQSGWLGRYLAQTASPSEAPFRAVGLGTMLQASLRGAPTPPVVLQSIADFKLQIRSEATGFQAHLEQLYEGEDWLQREGQSAFAALHAIAAEIGDQPYQPEHGAQYQANDSFHQALAQIAQLIKADVGLQVACVDITGWDTHANEVQQDDPTKGYLNNLLQRMATGITNFLVDLEDYLGDGALPGVTLVSMTEFGRRASENASFGSDHGHGSVMFLFGRAVNGGQVYANPWPTLAEDQLDRGDLRGTTEYRDVLSEILFKRMGAWDLGSIFPNHTPAFPGLIKPLVRPATATPTASPTSTVTATPSATATPTATSTPYVGQYQIRLPWVEKS